MAGEGRVARSPKDGETRETIEIEVKTWNLVRALVKTWVANEGDQLAVPLGDLDMYDERKLQIKFEHDWFVLTLTDEPSPDHVEYPDRAVAE